MKKIKENYGFALFVMTMLLVFIFIGMVCVSIKLDNMERVAKDRYISTVVAVDFTRDRVKQALENQEIILSNQIMLRDQTETIIDIYTWNWK